MRLLQAAGLVISERHGQFTAYRRDEHVPGALAAALERRTLVILERRNAHDLRCAAR